MCFLKGNVLQMKNEVRTVLLKQMFIDWVETIYKKGETNKFALKEDVNDLNVVAQFYSYLIENLKRTFLNEYNLGTIDDLQSALVKLF